MRSVLLPLIAALPLAGGASASAADIASGGTGVPDADTTDSGGAAPAPDAGGAAWEPAHWEDRGDARVWVEGRYVARPSVPPPNVVWCAGRWIWTQDGWVWSPGHYVSTAPAPVPQVDPPQTEVVVDEAPPPVQVDLVTPCPGPDFVWCGGCWDFRCNTWVWCPGSWCRRPFAGATWCGPRWDCDDRFGRGGHDVGSRGGFVDHGVRGGYLPHGGGFAAHGGYHLSPGHWHR